jgi:hypothetical protein
MLFSKIFASSAFITVGAGFYCNYKQPFCVPKVDYDKIREEIAEILPQPDFDYGSIGTTAKNLLYLLGIVV